MIDKSCINCNVHYQFGICVLTCRQSFEKKVIFPSIPQLQSTLLFTSMCGWLGILISMSLLMLHIMCLSFGQFAKMILFPPSSTVGVMSVLL